MKRSSRKLRYAVVGLGHIAQVAVIPAFKQAREAELVALVSGDDKKLRELAKRYEGVQTYKYEDYDRLLESGTIDAVYIALPNRMHEDYAIRAARAGIHILCEKPLAVDSRAAERVIRAARQSKVKLMVAYRLHFDRTNLQAIQIANSGKIGPARYFTSEFGYVLKNDNIRAEPEEGGSPLHDIGIYCINAVRNLFKAEPTSVYATAVSPDPKPSRILQTVAATLTFPGDRVGSFTCSFGAAPIGNYRVVGTKGDLLVENAYEYVGEVTQTLTVGEKKKTTKSKPGDQFAAELDYFAGCVRHDREPEVSGAEGLADLRVIEGLLRSIRTGKPVSLAGKMPRIARRPTLVQEIRRPAHKEPKLIKVEEASK